MTPVCSAIAKIHSVFFILNGLGLLKKDVFFFFHKEARLLPYFAHIKA